MLEPEAVIGEGVRGRGVGTGSVLSRDLADDGKRFDALDVAFQAGGSNRGGSPREGSGYAVGRGRRLEDFPFFLSFSWLFLVFLGFFVGFLVWLFLCFFVTFS